MNAKATRMLFTAVALSALAAVLASSAQAGIPEGNGTQPPSRTVVKKQQSLQEVLANSAQARIPEGNGTQPPSRTVVDEQQSPQGSRTFFVGPGFYGATTSATVVNERLARKGSRKLVIDAEICANLDRAIRLAIQQCLSHPVPLAAKQIRTGTSQARLKTLADGYSRLNS